MEYLDLSDEEFTRQIKGLSRLEMENLANNFNRKFDILRKEYQNKVEQEKALVSPTRIRTETSLKRVPVTKLSNLIGILEKKPISYLGNSLTLKKNGSGIIKITMYPNYHITYYQESKPENVPDLIKEVTYLGKLPNGYYQIQGSIDVSNLSEVLGNLLREGWDT